LEYFTLIPNNLYYFILVTIFSLIIGLSQRNLHPEEEKPFLFGTDRTFTFIGIFGFILYIIEKQNHILYIVGAVILAVFFGLYYHYKLLYIKKSGLTTVLIAFITYCLAPLVITQPIWLFLLVIVVTLILTELKESFMSISKKFDRNEFINLAKFLILAGVILPILPQEPLIKGIASLTPYKVWLAVVVISGISYISYLLRKFVFPKSGIMISGLLGGLYSSTAATVILSKKMKEQKGEGYEYLASIFLAIAMMYLRILVLALIFNKGLFEIFLPWFILLMVISLMIAFYYGYKKKKAGESYEQLVYNDKNPLEFKMSLVFTLLFIVFALATQYAIHQFGSYGLNGLSYIVGVSDIDPFLINLFQGKFEVSITLLAIASLQAILSNNIVKCIYACALAGKKSWINLMSGFAVIIAVNIFVIVLIKILY